MRLNRRRARIVGAVPDFFRQAFAGFAVVASITGVGFIAGVNVPVGSMVWKWSHPMSTGVNIPTISHYGYGDLVPQSTHADIVTDLSAVRNLGGSVLRIEAANDQITADESARRLDELLSKANGYHISVIVSLINYYGPGRNPKGTDGFYTLFWQGIPYLNNDFISSGYKGDYWDFVRTVVSTNKHHSNIYAWEPGNELQDTDKPAFLKFMRETTDFIKTLDPIHPVASGMIEAAQAGYQPDELYSKLPALDIITIHPGNGYRKSVVDVQWALAHNKKAIVEETGISDKTNRAQRFQHEMSYWHDQGVTAILFDGFIAKGLGDNGDGDQTLGLDSIWHQDYREVSALLGYSRP